MIRCVAFIHTYARDGELGSYMNKLVDAFVHNGIELHLIYTNHLVGNLANRSYRHDVSAAAVAKYITDLQPDFVFSTNRGGITREIMRAVECPIVTWLVDRIPFRHHGGDHHDLFCEKDYLITSAHDNIKYFEGIYPVLKGRVIYLPFATDPAEFSDRTRTQDVNVSFVGTYFSCGYLKDLLAQYRSDDRIFAGLLALSDEIKADYDLDIEAAIRRHGLQELMIAHDLDAFRLKGLVANMLSLNSRIQALHAVADLGLELYGTDNWVESVDYSLELMKAYQRNKFIKTREQLVGLYQRSKIGVNVSHVQAKDGLPYRVFDIMASNALLITDYRKTSDLYKLFGAELPVPMYRDPCELRSLVRHFLEHDDERRQIVAECNRLIANGHTFSDRVKAILDMLSLSTHEDTRGELHVVDVARFTSVTKCVMSSLDILPSGKSSRNDASNSIAHRSLVALARVCFWLYKRLPPRYKTRLRARVFRVFNRDYLATLIEEMR
ncbi:MAG: hypothetical protein Kow0096_13130 [Thiohalomonadaceae bacterium]